MITLCFDLGNTRLKCAVFENAKLKELIVMDNDAEASVLEIIEKYHPEKSILSSVINHDLSIEKILTEKTKFHKLSAANKLPFSTPVNKPETIGADRLALCAAAVNIFPNQHNLIIGLGSCITYNFINKSHEFLGGSISPGLEMRLRAMHEFTAKLPLVKPDNNFPLVGYNTATNLLSGAILGMRKEIDGMIDEYALKYGNFNALLTGGDLPFIASHLKNKIFANPHLIYKGLYAISEYNN